MDHKFVKVEIDKLYKQLHKYASLPAENYPPANIASWIKQCKKAGRDDLADRIMQGWNNCVTKYPQARLRWDTATVLGTNSVKKNVFGGKDVNFDEWFSSQGAPQQQVQEAKKIKEPKITLPPLATPEPNETPEQWQAEASKTKTMLDQGEAAFKNVDEFIAYLKNTVGDLQRKISEYGPGGIKEKTKSGAPHKFTERVPKWKAELETYSSKLEEVEKKTKQAKEKFEDARKSYDKSPALTVKYENKAQDALEDVLSFILNIEDFNKQKDMLLKFQDTLKKMESKKVASFDKEAAFWDALFKAMTNMFDYISKAWKKLMDWVNGLFKAIDKFNDLAKIEI